MKYDYLVIGGGSGGIASARRAARHGARVGLIEAGRLGGTCVNVGCVPKKLMWHAGQLAHALADAPGYGFAPVGITHDWGRLVADREAYLRRLNGIYQDNLQNDGVSVHRGRGRFLNNRTVELDGHELQAERILIATGGEPSLPDVPGVELGTTSDGFFAMRQRPQRVALVGSGYIGVELAGLLNALGSEVHLLMRSSRVLRHFDDLLSDTLMEAMRGSGIHMHAHTQPHAVESADHGVEVVLNNGRLKVDALIWAIGRHPNVSALGLEAAGVAVDSGGHIQVDEWQQTSVDGVFAVGDVTGAAALTPVAIQAGRRLADRLFGGDPQARLQSELVPTVVFSHPPIGTVGLSEAAARERYGDAVTVYSGHFKALYNALIEHKQPSAVKLVTVGEDERIVGLHAIGPGTDEMLQGFAVAVKMGARKRDLDDTIAIHPTAAEELVTLR